MEKVTKNCVSHNDAKALWDTHHNTFEYPFNLIGVDECGEVEVSTTLLVSEVEVTQTFKICTCATDLCNADMEELEEKAKKAKEAKNAAGLKNEAKVNTIYSFSFLTIVTISLRLL